MAIKTGMLAAHATAPTRSSANDTSGRRARALRGARRRTRGRRKSCSECATSAKRSSSGLPDRGAIDTGVQLVTGRPRLVEQVRSDEARPRRTCSRSQRRKPRSSRRSTASSDVRQADRRLPLGHGPRRGSAVSPGRHRSTADHCVTCAAPTEYGNPCQHFCPAAVYEWSQAPIASAARAEGGVRDQREQLRALQDVRHRRPVPGDQWIVPEGGGGPKYIDM
jgi:hypothetical protein